MPIQDHYPIAGVERIKFAVGQPKLAVTDAALVLIGAPRREVAA